MRILLAEDDENIRTILSLILQRLGGHEVVLAKDGLEALEQGLSQSFDLILLDGMMPKKSGLQVFRELRAAQPGHPPVIFLSAKTEPNEIAEFLKHGAGHIQKPFEPSTICARIEDVLVQINSQKGAA